MISPELEIALSVAFTQATQHQHEYVTCEHMLYALTFDPDTVRILEQSGADIPKLQKQLEDFLNENAPQNKGVLKKSPQMTVALQRVLQRATVHVQSSGKEKVTGADVLVALFGEGQSNAVYFLSEMGITRLEVVSVISHGGLEGEGEPQEELAGEGEQEAEAGRSGQSALEQFTDNYTQRAEEGKLDPLIGRDRELQRILHILCRRNKNNPLLIGDSGVGKTAIIQGLAQILLDEDVPEFLQGTEIFALDMGSLLAGTKYRGQFEERIKGVLKEIKKKEKALLFIDEIHTIIGAGAVSGGSLDASNLLKMPLSNGDLRCMGATTYEEFKNIEKDKALLRRFQKVEVNEPSVADTVKILNGLKDRFEKHHGITYSTDAIQAAAELGSKYMNDRRLPDKAVDIIDEAGAGVKLQSPENKKKKITAEDIEKVVSKMAKVPVSSTTVKESEKLKNLERDLKLVIFGQNKAVEEVVSAIKLSRSGLGNPTKPVGSFLFVGPTGVGKTELAKQLSTHLGVEFLRFDMSEYMEKHTVSRLIGAPPGYVGYEKGGLLTDAILKNPHSVLLLDEIEKAHPDLFAILLQVMDHASLTDTEGRKVDFRNVTLIMTTNAGAQEMFKKGMGIGTVEEKPDISKGEARRVLDRMFSPEFRNRLDAIVSFKALPNEIVLNIVDKFLTELQVLLDEKSVSMDVTAKARQFLVDQGYDSNFGARPLERLIQREIKKPLSEELLFGKLKDGGHVAIDVSGKKPKIGFKISKAQSAKKSKSKVEA